ncbi:MAG: hypothetical protein J0H17_03935 [Rhizobiales bacterium]|nr:hypothetical protein [Hyphomicrobiales bacterium]
MFNVTARPTFRREVKINTPEGDGFKQESLTATYRLLKGEEIDTHDLNTAKGTTGFVCAALVRLEGVTDDTGEIPYTDVLRDQVLEWPHVRVAIANAYFDEVGKARAGN